MIFFSSYIDTTYERNIVNFCKIIANYTRGRKKKYIERNQFSTAIKIEFMSSSDGDVDLAAIAINAPPSVPERARGIYVHRSIANIYLH